ncbi:hypothetical protein SH2C18_07520 [Clostridium sediminicola]|uniref:N-acetylglucosaminidase n=1 Tax=Clostridium sediminicola TaxID=3114879 RepID=UPI0031F2777D
MHKIYNYIKFFAIIFLIILISNSKSVNSLSVFQNKHNISTVKSWTVNLNSEVDPISITSNNIRVTDKNGNLVNSTISIGKNKKSIIIDPPMNNYIPDENYFIKIENSLKSKNGKLLGDSFSMKFSTIDKYEDTTNFSSLPKITNLQIIQQPILANNKLDLKIKTSTDTATEYRVYIHKYINEFYDATYLYENVNYLEITDGYTSLNKEAQNSFLSINNGLASGKYKIVVFIKRSGIEGNHKNQYTDYDNFYTSYFRVLDKDIIQSPSLNETYNFINFDKTLEEVTNYEYTNGAPVHDHHLGIKWIGVTENIISYYMNPFNFLDDYGKYIFLDLRYMDGISSQDLNNILVGKGILEGKGQAFLEASKSNNINPLYLLSHSLLETGNGKSVLARGVLVTEVDGYPVTPKITYNLYAVGAYDSDPNKYGSEYAYKQGWFSVETALSGGAAYIGSKYINNPKYNQNTLYEMRYNNSVKWHQYSTDIGWAYKQVKNIKYLIDKVNNAKPVFEIPVYK